MIEVLLEGRSDEPVVREVLTRHFSLTEALDFRLHPHRGKGKIPKNIHAQPDPKHKGLLDRLPAKLRGYSYCQNCLVVVLVDSDRDDCKTLKRQLVDLYTKLRKKPKHVLFRIAVQETESWLIADRKALLAAYPGKKKKIARLTKKHGQPWENLAKCLGRNPKDCTGADKAEWATKIAPFLRLQKPASQGLRAFIDGLNREIQILNAG